MGVRSASGELVKGTVGQAPRRRSGRLWGPAGGSTALRLPSAELVGAALFAAAALAVAVEPSGASAVPGPDPHPWATRPATTPAPDPSPAARSTPPTPDSAPLSPIVSSSTVESVPPASYTRPAAAQRTATKPKPKAKPKAKPNAKSHIATAKAQAPVPSARTGRQPIRVAAPSTTAASAARITKDPMILGALALLMLVLLSASLLLVLDRSESHGAGT
jgi:hypothetical protein